MNNDVRLADAKAYIINTVREGNMGIYVSHLTRTPTEVNIYWNKDNEVYALIVDNHLYLAEFFNLEVINKCQKFATNVIFNDEYLKFWSEICKTKLLSGTALSNAERMSIKKLKDDLKITL